jgi:hypothetical protein
MEAKRKATCHPEKPHHARGLCEVCYNREMRHTNLEYAKNQARLRKEYKERNKEKYVEYQKEYYIKNKNIKIDKSKKWYQDNKEIHKQKSRYRHLKNTLHKFGIEPEEYDKLIKNGCKICGSVRNLHIDHNHETGKFRGILCSKCNHAIGLFKENINNLIEAINYLKNE